MRRPRSTVAVGRSIVRRTGPGALAAAVVLAGLTGCGSDGSAGRPYEPTLPAVDFRPKLVLEVGDAGLVTRAGERADPAVRTEPPTVPGGSVVEVRNAGPGEHRLRAEGPAEPAFDTGILHAGEHSTAVVANTDDVVLVLDLVEVIADRSIGTLTVEPRPAPDH